MPDGLAALISSPRSKFAVLWRACETPDDLRQVARMLASSKDWTQADVASALLCHDVAPSRADAERMAAEAAEAAAQARAADSACGVRVVAVLVCKPPRVVIAMGEQTAEIEMKQLASRPQLRQACLDAFLVAPTLPKKDFDGWLNDALMAAERVEPDHDSTDAEHDLWIIERVLEGLPSTDSADGTAYHRAWIDEGRAFVSLPAMMADTIRPNYTWLTVRRVAECLRELGWEPVKIRHDDRTLRLWRGTRRADADWQQAGGEIASLQAERNKRMAERRQAKEGSGDGW